MSVELEILPNVRMPFGVIIKGTAVARELPTSSGTNPMPLAALAMMARSSSRLLAVEYSPLLHWPTCEV